jgi:hypothetical protein
VAYLRRVNNVPTPYSDSYVLQKYGGVAGALSKLAQSTSKSALNQTFLDVKPSVPTSNSWTTPDISFSYMLPSSVGITTNISNIEPVQDITNRLVAEMVMAEYVETKLGYSDYEENLNRALWATNLLEF